MVGRQEKNVPYLPAGRQVTIFLKNRFLCTNNELASAIQVSDCRFLNLAALTYGLVSVTQIFPDTSLLIF